MTRCLGFVASVSKTWCNGRSYDRYGRTFSRLAERSAVRGCQCQVDSEVALREVALNDREFEAAMKEITVSDQRADTLPRSLLESARVFTDHGGATREINISGNQALVGLAVAFCLAGPLLWAFVRYWLFAP
jgi:hypothetical protein